MSSDVPHLADTSNVDQREVILVADRVSVVYDRLRIGTNRSSRNPLKRAGILPSRTAKVAVDNATIIAREGERIGVVGRNGSGKSTLLRALAGLEFVSSGNVLARTQPVLLGVNPALIPERTGYENITLGCLAMGMTPTEAKDLVPKIAELADLGRELHDPINTYSSGMGSRLRFSIAASNPNTEILIIDEALGTGDAAFQERSEAAVRQIVDNAGTIFFVSHVPSAVVKMCERAIWMFEGRPIMDGPSRDVALTYQKWSNHTVAREFDEARELVERTESSYLSPTVAITPTR